MRLLNYLFCITNTFTSISFSDLSYGIFSHPQIVNFFEVKIIHGVSVYRFVTIVSARVAFSIRCLFILLMTLNFVLHIG